MSQTSDPWAALAVQTPTPSPAAPTPPTPAPTPADRPDPWAALANQAQPSAPAVGGNNYTPDPWTKLATEATSSVPPSQAATKQEAPTFIGKTWDWLNSPLLDVEREGAGPIEAGVERFVSGFSSPLSLALIAGSFGGSLLEQGLVRGGMSTIDAIAAVKKAKLFADLGFLTKYGMDFGRNTLPQLEMNWGDYQAATNDRDKQHALDRFEELSTEAVLGTLATAVSARGVARDFDTLFRESPKGRALGNNDYADKIYGYQEANQVGTGQGRQVFNLWRKLIPKAERRNAITRNIEAGGDPRVLESQAQTAEQDPATAATAKEFRDAKQLSPLESRMRDEMRQLLAGDLAHLKAMGLLPEDGGLQNYMPHLWDFEDLDPETGRVTTRKSVDGDRDMLKKRTFATYAEGEAKGAKPTTKDAALLIADYHERVSNLVAKHELAEGMAGGRMNSGAPMAAPGHLWPGFTRPHDAPVDPLEVENLKKAGKFDALLASNRIYEVPVKPKPAAKGGAPADSPAAQLDLEHGGAESTETALATQGTQAITPFEPKNEARVIGGEPPERAYMWKQSDYVPSGLSVWRPISEAEVADNPNSVVTYSAKEPFPSEEIMEPGQKGYPSGVYDTPERIPHARVPVYVHPDIAPHLEPVLESTRPKNALVRAFLDLSKETKSSLLALSPFHWFTILNRSLESGINPFGESANRKYIFAPKDIDYFNLTDSQKAAIRDGVVVSSTRPGFSGYTEEGLNSADDSIINRIPLIGGFNRAIEDRLFGPHGWISSLKFDLYDKLSGEIQKSKPNLSPEEAGRIAAAQVNNKFGGLNYTVLGRGATTQHTLRSLLLAPDFLESSGRSILDVAGDHGQGLVKSLVAFNVTQWLLARAANYLVSGDTRPASGFSVQSKDGKKDYNLRTTLGDFLHFVEHPKDFLSNRVNPAGIRAPYEIAAGEDQLGNKVTNWQEFFDTLRQVTPIPLQGIYPTGSVTEPSPGDKVLQSLGVQAKRHFSPAETLAHQLGSHQNEEGTLEGEDLERAQLKAKLEGALRDSINTHDQAGRVAAMGAIHAATQGPKAKLTPDDASKLIVTAHKYPMALQSQVDHLAIGDALQVFNAASLTEKKALKPIIQSKIQKWMLASNKHTREQNETVRRQVQAFRQSELE